LLSIEIFGYRDPLCRRYADHLGKALQLTNILRDVGNDAVRGRIYLPLSDLERFRIDPGEILRREWSERFRELAMEVADRAKTHYRLAREALPRSELGNMRTADLMGNVYWHLLRRLEASRFQVLGETPVRLSRLTKLSLVVPALIKARFGIPFADYGR
jgi:phytoene synthase